MEFLLNQPLRRKLLVVMMVTTTAALILAAASVSIYQWFALQDSAHRDLQAQAEILAANLSAAVAFTDVAHAQRTLQVLQARTEFELACVFDENRRLLAGYTNGAGPAEFVLPVTLPTAVQSAEGRFAIYQPVIHNQDRVGTLYLRSRFAPGKARFLHYLGLVAAVSLACWAITFWLATRLQRVVSQPILDLSRTTREVTECKDYSLRAVKQSHDEVGLLIDGFNEMLAQIQTRDAALQKAHDGLERRVGERTGELQQEIAERRRVEAALADEKERLTVTLGSIGEAVVATDCQGRILVFNPVAEILTGWSAGEAVNRPLEEVLQLHHAKTRQRRENPVICVLSTGGSIEQSEDVVLMSRGGGQRLIDSSSSPIRDRSGQIIGVVLVFRDITEKERTTQELLKARKLESVGLLAGGIAHDFNNILTIILGNISLARILAPLQADVAEALAQAEQAAVRASDLTRQLLTFAKGGVPVKRTSSLGEMIQETSSFVLHGSNVGVQLEIADDLWPANIDVGQISRVIQNLVLNAAQAMPAGGTVRVSAANETLERPSGTALQPGRFITITVQDSGCGITPENLPRVFDPYFTTKKQGSGLGLATSYSIIRKHDGDITVQSELGRGTTFRVYLPAALTPVAASDPVRGAVPSAPTVGKGRILVMDDEAPIRDLVARMLQPLGYEVATAEDGAEALRLYETARADGHPFSVVVLDLTVPGGLGGQQTLQRLLTLDPHAKAIVSSGYSEDPIMANYHQYGFAGMVAKPYRLREFSRTLKEVMQSAAA